MYLELCDRNETTNLWYNEYAVKISSDLKKIVAITISWVYTDSIIMRM